MGRRGSEPGDDLTAKEGPAVVNAPVDPREVRTRRADLLAEQPMPERLRRGCLSRWGK